jgi:hypothetical protein
VIAQRMAMQGGADGVSDRAVVQAQNTNLSWDYVTKGDHSLYKRIASKIPFMIN